MPIADCRFVQAEAVAFSRITAARRSFRDVPGLNVSANYFDVLGVKPALGRTFLPGEDVAGHERVIVISDDLWRRNFAADTGIVNQMIAVAVTAGTVLGDKTSLTDYTFA